MEGVEPTTKTVSPDTVSIDEKDVALNNLKKHNDVLMEQLEEKDLILANLKKGLTIVNGAKDGLHEGLIQLKSDMDKLKKELEEKEERIQELNNLNEYFKKEKSDLSMESEVVIQKLKSQIHEIQVKFDLVCKEKETFVQKIQQKHATEDVEGLKRELKKKEVALEEIQLELNELAREKDKLEEKIRRNELMLGEEIIIDDNSLHDVIEKTKEDLALISHERDLLQIKLTNQKSEYELVCKDRAVLEETIHSLKIENLKVLEKLATNNENFAQNMKERDEKIAEIQGSMWVIRNQNNNLQKERKKFEQEIKDANHRADRLKEDYIKLLGEKENLEKQLDEKVTNFNTERENFQKQLLAQLQSKKEISVAEENNHNWSEERINLEREFEEKIATLTSERDNLQKQMEILVQQKSELERLCEERNKEIERVSEEKLWIAIEHEELSKKVDALLQGKQKIEELLQDQNKKIEEISKQRADLEVLCEDQKRRLESVFEGNARVSEDMEAILKQLDILGEEKRKLQLSYEKARTELENVMEKNRVMGKELEEKIAARTSERDISLKQAEDIREEKRQLEQELNKANQEKEKLEKKCVELIVELEGTQESKSKINSLEEVLSVKKGEKQELEKLCEEQRKRLESVFEENGTIKSEREEAKRQLAIVTEGKKEMEHLCDDQMKRLDEILEKNRQLERDFEKRITIIFEERDGIKKELEALSEQKRELEKICEEQRARLENIFEEQSLWLQEKEEEKCYLQKELHNSYSQFMSTHSQINLLKREKGEINELADKLSARLELLEKEKIESLKLNEECLERLEVELKLVNELKTKLHNFTIENEILMKKIVELEIELDDVKKAKNEAVEDRMDAIQRLDMVQNIPRIVVEDVEEEQHESQKYNKVVIERDNLLKEVEDLKDEIQSQEGLTAKLEIIWAEKEKKLEEEIGSLEERVRSLEDELDEERELSEKDKDDLHDELCDLREKILGLENEKQKMNMENSLLHEENQSLKKMTDEADVGKLSEIKRELERMYQESQGNLQEMDNVTAQLEGTVLATNTNNIMRQRAGTGESSNSSVTKKIPILSRSTSVSNLKMEPISSFTMPTSKNLTLTKISTKEIQRLLEDSTLDVLEEQCKTLETKLAHYEKEYYAENDFHDLEDVPTILVNGENEKKIGTIKKALFGALMVLATFFASTKGYLFTFKKPAFFDKFRISKKTSLLVIRCLLFVIVLVLIGFRLWITFPIRKKEEETIQP